MEPVLALALLSLGSFVGILVCGIFYVVVIRPRLLEAESTELVRGEVVSDERLALLDGLKPQIDRLSQLTERDEQYQLAAGQVQEKLNRLESLLSERDQELRLMTEEMRTTFSDLIGQLEKRGQPASPASGDVESKITELGDQLVAKMATIESALEEQDRKVSGQLNILANDVGAIKRRELVPPARLTDIKGIGAKYSGLLHDAGIHHFEQLAEMTPEELRNLIDVPSWRRIKAEAWIEQAKLFASQRKKVGD